MTTDEPTATTLLVEVLDVLQQLNRAVWTDFPEWAITRTETARASEVLAAHAAQVNDG